MIKIDKKKKSRKNWQENTKKLGENIRKLTRKIA